VWGYVRLPNGQFARNAELLVVFTQFSFKVVDSLTQAIKVWVEGAEIVNGDSQVAILLDYRESEDILSIFGSFMEVHYSRFFLV
jgi:hypothetical protein